MVLLGSLKAEVVDENTLRITPGSDLVFLPNLVVVSGLCKKNGNKRTDRHPMNPIY